MMKNFTEQQINAAIDYRRAIKYFDPKFIIDDQILETILQQALNIPFPFTAIPFRLFQVIDPQIRQQIRLAGFDQPQHTEASVWIAMSVDLTALERVKSNLSTILFELTPNELAMYWSAMYSQAIMLSAAVLEIDSCPMIGFDYKQVSSLLNLPKHYCLTHTLVLGKYKTPPLLRGSKLALDNVLTTPVLIN